MKSVKSMPLLLSLLCPLVFLHCGDAGTRVQNPPTVTTSQVYPTNLAITSALQTATAATSNNLVNGEALHLDEFTAITGEINDILTGTDLTDCEFDPAPLLAEATNAVCYGPKLNYVNHPDGSLPNEGDLPVNDLGLWTANEYDSTEACSAAEVKNLVQGVSHKANVVLKGLASMVCAANVNSKGFPAAGNSISILYDMTTLSNTVSSMADVSFNIATISLATDPDDNYVYTYDLQFIYTDVQGAHNVFINMIHKPLDGTAIEDTSSTTYQGKLSYKYDRPSVMKCTTESYTASTIAGSVLYNKAAQTDISFQADWAYYCGLATDITPTGDDGLLAPTLRFSLDATGGWIDNYSRFLAGFDPTTQAGDYAYAWQAGTQDGHTRVFNLAIDAGDPDLTGVAFYGYGPSVDDAEFAGQISGFICNWAAPGNNHTMQNLVQRQLIKKSGDLFIVNTDDYTAAEASNIAYAPTNSCDYVVDDTNPFEYYPLYQVESSDVAGDANDPTDPDNHLLLATDDDGDGYLDVIHDAVDGAGFTLPTVTD